MIIIFRHQGAHAGTCDDLSFEHVLNQDTGGEDRRMKLLC